MPNLRGVRYFHIVMITLALLTACGGGTKVSSDIRTGDSIVGDGREDGVTDGAGDQGKIDTAPGMKDEEGDKSSEDLAGQDMSLFDLGGEDLAGSDTALDQAASDLAGDGDAFQPEAPEIISVTKLENQLYTEAGFPISAQIEKTDNLTEVKIIYSVDNWVTTLESAMTKVSSPPYNYSGTIMNNSYHPETTISYYIFAKKTDVVFDSFPDVPYSFVLYEDTKPTGNFTLKPDGTEDQPFKIGATASDNWRIKEVILYYRLQNAIEWEMATMTKTSSGLGPGGDSGNFEESVLKR